PRGPNPPAAPRARHSGQHQVEHHHVVVVPQRSFERRLAVGDGIHLESLVAQRVLDSIADRRLVVDEEDPVQLSTNRAAPGTLSRTVVPSPRGESSPGSPSRASATARTIASPSPKPDVPSPSAR